MRVLKFFLLFLLTPFFSQAQLMVDGMDLNQRDDLHFIEISPRNPPFESNLRVHIDYGQPFRVVENANLMDARGEKMEFNSIVHILNFFTDQGWEVWKMMPMDGEISNDESNRISIFFRRQRVEN